MLDIHFVKCLKILPVLLKNTSTLSHLVTFQVYFVGNHYSRTVALNEWFLYVCLNYYNRIHEVIPHDLLCSFNILFARLINATSCSYGYKFHCQCTCRLHFHITNKITMPIFANMRDFLFCFVSWSFRLQKGSHFSNLSGLHTLSDIISRNALLLSLWSSFGLSMSLFHHFTQCLLNFSPRFSWFLCCSGPCTVSHCRKIWPWFSWTLCYNTLLWACAQYHSVMKSDDSSCGHDDVNT